MKELSLDNYRLLQELYLLLDNGDRRLLRRFDLTNRQYHTLQHLPPGTSRNLTEMSELLFCDKSNVTGLVERMERDGLVTRGRSESDRRYMDLSITSQGDQLREASRHAHDASIAERFEILSEDEQAQLNHLLTKLAEGLRTSLNDSA